jgi:hypothetical protein
MKKEQELLDISYKESVRQKRENVRKRKKRKRKNTSGSGIGDLTGLVIKLRTYTLVLN